MYFVVNLIHKFILIQNYKFYSYNQKIKLYF